jgi:hypothetical protein
MGGLQFQFHLSGSGTSTSPYGFGGAVLVSRTFYWRFSNRHLSISAFWRNLHLLDHTISGSATPGSPHSIFETKALTLDWSWWINNGHTTANDCAVNSHIER